MVLCIVTSSKFKPLLLLCAGSLLAACATGPANISTSVPEQKARTDNERKADALTARQLYQQAVTYQGEAQHFHLLQAARQALTEQDTALALAITESLKQSPYPLIRRQLPLPLLKAYLAGAQHSHINALLDSTDSQNLPKEDQAEYLLLAAKFHSAEQRYLPASKMLLSLLQQPAVTPPTEAAQLLWQNLSALSDSQLESLRTNASNNTLGWLSLAQLSRRYIGQPEALQQAFTEWQQRYPALAADNMLPAGVKQLFALTPYQPNRIGVLLPLSGQFRQHAQAVQYGILAAASQRNTSQLVFIDSQQDTAALQQQLTQQQVDFVIGPLLKPQVDSISQQTDWHWPTLFLNSKDARQDTAVEQFYFALSMEDEASQMAQLFARKNYRRPVVITANSNINQRMLQRFVSEWQQLGNAAPEHYQFNAKEDLDSLINSLLETNHSRERVKQISNLISEKLEADPHSRLDIDAIYLIADPVQTRLFKPFVDVSVSPVAPKIPVYASSRSHSTSLDSTDQRDLNGLTFTEMPWMLGEQSSMALRQQYQQTFSEQDETLQRLFAMGYDAYQMIGSLRQQQQLPAAVFPGLTGQLRLAADGSLVRQLSWASYRNNRLRAVQEP